MELTTYEIATRLEGVLVGDENLLIRGVSDAEKAREGEITFAEKARYLEVAERGKASAVLVSKGVKPRIKTAIQVSEVRVALAEILEWFHPEALPFFGQHSSYETSSNSSTSSNYTNANYTFHPDAKVHPSAQIGQGCVIEKGCIIDREVVLMGGNYIGANCHIGASSKLFPNVILYMNSTIGKRCRIHAGSVIGADGYHYVWDGKKHRKIADIGGVNVGDDVEIGANVTIDRGAFRDTQIGEGTKIDNLVQIAHNVEIGKHCLIISQVGIAGSTRIGDGTIVAGQVGIAGHLKIGGKVQIAAQSGVMRDISDGQKVFGSPAQSDREFKRQWLALQQLPDLLRRFREMQKQLDRKTKKG